MAPQPSQTELERRAAILDELMRSHRRELRAQASRHSSVKRYVDDALSDASVAFLRFYKGPEGVQALRYMMICVKTAAWAIDRRRRRIEERDVDRFMPEEVHRRRIAGIPESGEEPHERYERVESAQERIDLLDQLKPDERTAITMFAYGFSYEEICDRKGWTYTKVNRCMAEGRQRLRQLLATQEGGS